MKKYLEMISKESEFVNLFLSEIKKIINEEKNNKGAIEVLSVIEYFNSTVQMNNDMFKKYYLDSYGIKNNYILKNEGNIGFDSYVECIIFNISKSKNKVEIKSISLRKKIDDKCCVIHCIEADRFEIKVQLNGNKINISKKIDFKISKDKSELFKSMSGSDSVIIEGELVSESSNTYKKLLKHLNHIYGLNNKYRELIIESIILNKEVGKDKYDLLMIQEDFIDNKIYKNNKLINIDIKGLNRKEIEDKKIKVEYNKNTL